MKLIFGTSNHAKLESMKRTLSQLDLNITGLNDWEGKLPEINENGKSPLENAKKKALAYYQTIKTPVFSCDSGLYIEGAPDEWQPGVHVRNVNGKHLNDEEMIRHYSSLASKMGGRMTVRYKNGICLVLNENERYEYMGDDIAGDRFIIAEKPHKKRLLGFPLDSLSVHMESGRYYYDLDELKDRSSMDKGFQDFFKRVLPNRTTVSFYGDVDRDFKYVAIVSKHNNKWLYVRRKDRNTFEIPGGRIEAGENPVEAAKRELYEETGATKYTLDFVSVYTVSIDGVTEAGCLYYGEIKEMSKLPDYEMAERRLFANQPEHLTYPRIQPILLKKVQDWLIAIK